MSELSSLNSKELNIGVVADLHADPFGLHVAEALKKQSLDAVAFLGDAPANFDGTQHEHLRDIGNALLLFDTIGVPVFWIPGNYEYNLAYRAAFRELEDRLDNVIDVSEHNVVPFRGREFVFVPGSSTFTKGYHVTAEVPTGTYPTNIGPVHAFNPNDLKTLVKDPDKTVVFAHHPPLMDGNHSIDLAIHAVNGNDMKYMGERAVELIRKGRAKPLLSHQGDPLLAKILREVGVQKFFSGDIHEARGIVDSDGNPISEGQYSKHLFGNPGPAKEGYYGIVTLKNDGTCAMRIFNVSGEKQDYFAELKLR